MNEMDILLNNAKNSRELSRERWLGFFIGVIATAVICVCANISVFVWLFNYGNQLTTP